ncbi:hypothetical protein N9317_06005, partial [Pelagibacteraceae bacterium]|nr:hypothetical protein [Pelagibacteraceae bacterium]
KIYFLSLNKTFNLNFYLSLLLTSICLVLLVNALNMADGINGLAVGISLIWIISYILIFDIENKVIIILLCLILIFNFFYIYKGSYFLGNSGSLFLSSFIGLIFISEYNKMITEQLISVEIIVLIFLIPGLDMMRLFIFRLLNKKNPFEGDNDHLHHFFLKKFGLNKALVIYFVMLIIPSLLGIFINVLTSLVTSVIAYTAIIILLKIKSFFNN